MLRFSRRVFFLLPVLLCCSMQKFERESFSLNGTWDFYPNGDTTRYDIRVPSFWDAPQDYGYPMEWLHMKHGIYRKKFFIPSGLSDRRLFLKINRVSVIARVFVNGLHVGGETSGGYLMMQLPYRIDITGAAGAGQENEVEIRVWGGQSLVHGVNDRLQDIQDFPADAMDEGKLLYPWCVDHYDGRRGVNGDVTLVALPRLYVSDVFVVPDLSKNKTPVDDCISLYITLTNTTKKTKKITLNNNILNDNRVVKTFEDREVTVGPQQQQLIKIDRIPWRNAEYWWPFDPVLYKLHTRIVENEQIVDRVDTRFGFRQFYTSGNHFELNGIRANLRGDAFEFSWHEGYRHGPSTCPVLSTKELTAGVQKRLLEAYKALNMNVMRPHKASGLDVTYDYCDEIGLMVMDEAPFRQTQQRTDERAAAHFQDWVRRWVRERRNHPSIIMWIIANECWDSPIPEYTFQAATAVDNTRPIFHQGIRSGDFEGDVQCVHYTGGYPMKAFNRPDLYNIYTNHPEKPKSEGEALFPDGWPLKAPDGRLTGKRSERGDFENPDMVSQAEFLRGTARLLRAMRFAELADSRLYANWMYAFKVIETDIRPVWPDPAAPGLQPLVLHRPVCNTFTEKYPVMNTMDDGRTYLKNSCAPVAVFDKKWDADNLLGVAPKIYRPGNVLHRTLVIYNDEFCGGDTITVTWIAQAVGPGDQNNRKIASGSFVVNVAYGEKKLTDIKFKIPADIRGAHWLDLVLQSEKGGEVKFFETNRLGVLNNTPKPRLFIRQKNRDLGILPKDFRTQWKKIKLLNRGGGLSVRWSVAGADENMVLLRHSGNLRGEEELYYRIDTAGLKSGENYKKELVFAGGNSTCTMTVAFTVGP